ncbi:sodium/proton antiporter, CPA1 family (TC 2.A.36) [Saccharopolyspora kobensis]|uniref:Sodium/proton antiporter, CPA1 family n=1 Tax=Saccharopolyspora kobensis TaxID=146035 RepID=A0A1H6E2C2_9PSEU|nr:Na+/H+ antiporter [Saccharopolyspora kobensis]SEG91313.1 sodium/proton antiporter, CPA1 family (TC 2.A.36) [Saccharopolyspora kobensis]SFF14791.1 sodium/proton antiporter, CPA1 family [Saccharopolyspora kobensis]
MVQLLLVLVGALLVTALARSREIAAPLLLVLVGLLVSLIPGTAELNINPELLLTVVLPPLLYAAALESSYTNFRAQIRKIAHHGVLQVIATSFVIGWLAYALIPELPLTSAIVLGAVIAPPDAVTASAIGRQLKLPRGVMTILGGESLINDAAALTIYRMAIAAVVGATPTLAHGVLVFVLAVVFGVGLGLVFGVLAQAARTRIPDVQVATVLGVLVPFIAYLTAEELYGSGVLAVVTAGLYVGHNQPRARAAGRLQEHTVWASINLLLESLVFAYIGLQLKAVVDALIASGRDISSLLLATLAIFAATVCFRILWMFSSNYLPGLSHLLSPGHRPGGRWRRTAVISWAGMRGVVTLAAAGAIPFTTSTGEPFPARDLIQFVASVITVATILVQGTTLPWLIRKLDVIDPAEAARDDHEEAEARVTATNAALRYLDGLTPADLHTDPERFDRIITRMKALVEHQGMAAAEQVGRTPAEREDTSSRGFSDLRRDLLEVQRSTMADERDAGNLDDEVLRRVLRELDLQEAALDSSWRNR